MSTDKTPGWIAGIDVGGTFTDLIAIDTASGAVRLAKVPTTPQNQAYGVLSAIESAGLDLAQLALIVHGTTTTTTAANTSYELSNIGVGPSSSSSSSSPPTTTLPPILLYWEVLSMPVTEADSSFHFDIEGFGPRMVALGSKCLCVCVGVGACVTCVCVPNIMSQMHMCMCALSIRVASSLSLSL